MLHEYPGSGIHTTQNMGPFTDDVPVTAIVIGRDYDIQRDKLLAALRKPGPGPLVHRYYGQFDVELRPGSKWKLTESQEEGGMAIFEIPFIRAGATKSVTVTVDTAKKVRSSASAAKAVSTESFNKKVNTLGPEFIRDAIMGTLNRANYVVSGINSQVTGALATPTIAAGLIATLGNSAATLVATPSRIGELGAGLYEIQEAIFGAIEDIGLALLKDAAIFGIGPEAAAAQVEARKVSRVTRSSQQALMTSLGSQEPKFSTAGELGQRQATNQAAVLGLIRRAGTIEAARVAAALPYDSRDTASDIRKQLEAALVTLAETADDDDVYSALTDLRVDLVRHLASTAGELPRVVPFTPVTTLPALVIAYRVHGTALRNEEIVARNNIRHPGFTPAASPLKVLADA